MVVLGKSEEEAAVPSPCGKGTACPGPSEVPAGSSWPVVPHFLLHFHDTGLVRAHEAENPQPFTIHRRPVGTESPRRRGFWELPHGGLTWGGQGQGRVVGGAAAGSQQRGEIVPSSYSETWRDPGDDYWCLLETAGSGFFSSQLPSSPERAWWGCGPAVKGTPGT